LAARASRQVDQVGLLEGAALAELLAGVRRFGLVEGFAEGAHAGGRGLHHADELARGALGGDAAGELGHALALGAHLLGVGLRVLGAADVTPAPVGVAAEGEACG
jgi:hypothetical protein